VVIFVNREGEVINLELSAENKIMLAIFMENHKYDPEMDSITTQKLGLDDDKCYDAIINLQKRGLITKVRAEKSGEDEDIIIYFGNAILGNREIAYCNEYLKDYIK